ncbi:hypothetical protein L9F63_018736 [Diploptera punctata]|uniref:Gustatory receptor n=1 Tax=Diploptera punctata TaxID=6984 RepID=A0AAD8EEY5_DIPPU|nr:hypothetical protein L9F63_018736 [Diploptera punctata]
MWTQRVFKEVRPFLIICKVFGLAPYTIRINLVTGEGTVDKRFIKNVGGWISTITLSASMVFGLFDSITISKHMRRSTITDALTTIFCIPMFFLLALSSMLINSTIIKNNINQVLKTFSFIENRLLHLRRKPVSGLNIWSVKNILLHMDILILIFVIVPYLIYDSIIWKTSFYIIHFHLIRISQIVSIITVMQYCKFVFHVGHILSEFCKILSQFIESDYSRNDENVLTVTQLSKSRIYCRPKSFRYMTETIVSLRRMYNQLCDAVYLINKMFGLLILLEIVTNVTAGITHLSTVMNILKLMQGPHHPTGYRAPLYLISCTLCIVISFSLVITMIVLCQITIWKTKELNNIVNKISLIYPLNPDTMEQLKLFSSDVSNIPFEFKAFSLFRLDYTLLCTIFASAVTYTIFLIQLNQ